MYILYYALFVSAMMFSRKWVIFQKLFFIKLSHFPMFGSNFKWLEKQSHNFPYLACCEIELFSKKNYWKTMSKNKSYFLCWPKIVFLWLIFFFLCYQTLENTENYLYTRFSIETNGALLYTRVICLENRMCLFTVH